MAVTRSARARRCLTCSRSNALLLWMLASVVLGISLGVLLRYVAPFTEPQFHAREVMYLYLPGEILLRIVTFAAVPLLVTSLVSTIASLDLRSSGMMGVRLFLYYLVTTFIAAAEGLAWFYILQPGKGVQPPPMYMMGGGTDVTLEILDVLRNMFPDNFVGAVIYKTQTIEKIMGYQNISGNLSMEITKLELTRVDGVNMLGLTVCSIGFALAVAAVGEKGKIILHIFTALFHTIMLIFKAFLWVYPVAIIFMLARSVVEMQDPVKQMQSLFYLLLAIICGLSVHTLIFYPIILKMIGKRNPFTFYRGLTKAMLTALGTSSSMTLPVTMQCLTHNNHVDPRVVGFVCPLGSNINMDGMALTLVIIMITMLQIRGMTIGVSQVLHTTFLVIMLSIGAPGLPGIGAPVILFESLGLPLSDIALLAPIAWIFDRLTTVTNILGDGVGTAVLQNLSRKELLADSNTSVNLTQELPLHLTNQEEDKDKVEPIVTPL